MEDDKLQAIVAGEIEDAVQWVDDELSPIRTKATDYYHARPFGNEEDGRSQVVSSDVRDTVLAMMPSLMKIFFGSENVVEYAPQSEEDVELAKQATDYVNYVVQRDNPGFMVFYAAFKDALIRKTGIIKYWWEEKVDAKVWELSGLDEMAMAVLASDPDVQIEITNQVPEEEGIIYDLRLTRSTSKGRAKIAAVPPEEFLISRRAASIEDARMVAHRQLVPASDLIAMGYDPDTVMANIGDDQLEQSEERRARRIDGDQLFDDAIDKAMQLVSYVEAYIRVDYDGDGVAELRKICTMGPGHEIVANEPCAIRPFVDLCPDPEPHTFIGSSLADITSDIQRIKSMIMRSLLDSLALTITPRMAVVEGQVNMDDVLNTEVGAIVRMRQPGMVQPLETPFLGQPAFPILEYMDNVRENRTGITKAAAGLDPDALQSTTKAAVAATVTAAQERIELIARIFAEGGVSDLFRGLLKLITTHQDQPRMVRLRNRWVPIDPRAWDADMDVVTNVALGTGDIETKMAFLSGIATRQEAVLTAMGPDNPIVGLENYRHTMMRMLEVMQIRDASQYWRDPAQYQQQPQEPAPNPDLMLAQASIEQMRAESARKDRELELKREDMVRKDDLERDKLDADIALRAAEITAQYGAQIDIAGIRAQVERDRNAAQQATQVHMHEREMQRADTTDEEGDAGE